jgi:DUF1009 family protein
VGGRDVIGLIAGEGELPVQLARAARAAGHRVLAISVEGDAAALEGIADEIHRVGFGELRRIIDLLAAGGARAVLFAGGVSRARLVGEGDETFRSLAGEGGGRGDQTVFEVGRRLLEQAGITVASPLQFLGHLRVAEGVLTRARPSASEWADVRLGLRAARAAAGLEFGQTVVLRRGVILAVEGAEGTDETIRRGGRLASGAVVVKAARPRQDERFDLPAAGPRTLRAMAEVGARVLALEAGRTLLLDREETVAIADRAGIALAGVAAPD